MGLCETHRDLLEGLNRIDPNVADYVLHLHPDTVRVIVAAYELGKEKGANENA